MNRDSRDNRDKFNRSQLLSAMRGFEKSFTTQMAVPSYIVNTGDKRFFQDLLDEGKNEAEQFTESTNTIRLSIVSIVDDSSHRTNGGYIKFHQHIGGKDGLYNGKGRRTTVNIGFKGQYICNNFINQVLATEQLIDNTFEFKSFKYTWLGKDFLGKFKVITGIEPVIKEDVTYDTSSENQNIVDFNINLELQYYTIDQQKIVGGVDKSMFDEHGRPTRPLDDIFGENVSEVGSDIITKTRLTVEDKTHDGLVDNKVIIEKDYLDGED